MNTHKNADTNQAGRLATRPAATPTSDVVAQTLTAAPGSTAAKLAAASGLGKSTVSKALAALEAAGTARREPGGRDGARRLPDRWAPAPAPATTAEAATPSRRTMSKAAGNVTGRLGKGELGVMVLDYLTAHPDEEVGPTIVAHALDRSQGAVANALTKLVTTGQAQLSSESPRRYCITATT